MLFAVAVAALLVPSPFDGRAATTSFDLLHFPCFAVFSIAVLAMARRLGWRSAGRRAGVAIAVLAFAMAMEALQQLSGRSPTTHDMVANAAGVVSGWMLYEAWRQPQAMPRRVAITLAFVLLAYTSYRPVLTLWDLWQRSQG
ncbi:VanZ family protein [Roseimaritima sediminicola]|uniref:hypothetical protein n=1 Tax=Roseimaritima sediminicola TaxID=2662066 RepID=UPI00129842EE|nr:hypothetical protein [Roseimaritima sediminicola]